MAWAPERFLKIGSAESNDTSIRGPVAFRLSRSLKVVESDRDPSGIYDLIPVSNSYLV